MFRHALAAALRHLARSQLSAAIAVGGLAIGLCTALLAALVIHNQYTFDHFVPGYERTYVVSNFTRGRGLVSRSGTFALYDIAEQIARRADVELVTRVFSSIEEISLGPRKTAEPVYWAGPDLNRMLPMRVLAGDVEQALDTADGLVLSEQMARSWFHEDAALGRRLTIAGGDFTVRAVIADPPEDATHIRRQILISARSTTWPGLQGAEANNHGAINGHTIGTGYTYVRLRPGASVSGLAASLDAVLPPPPGEPRTMGLEPVRLDRLNRHEGFAPGFGTRIVMIGALGLIVFVVAAVNFVNLQVARGLQRSREVAIRRLAGAQRGTLVAQFLGEALLYALVAALTALALAELTLPRVNAFLQTGARLDYRGDLALVAALIGGATLAGLLAGAWPAFVLSGLRPLRVLRGERVGGRRQTLTRQLLVAFQFALLIALGIAAGVAWRQRAFAMHEALHFDADQVLLVNASGEPARADEIRRLPGVRAATRTGGAFLGPNGFRGVRGMNVNSTRLPDGEQVSVNLIAADFDLFAFYGVRPLAGQLDGAARSAASWPKGSVVINETALRRLRLGPAEGAIGKQMPVGLPAPRGQVPDPEATRIVAVVPDFTLGPVTEPIPPTMFWQPDEPPELLNVRLAGDRIPETLAAIDALWRDAGGNRRPLRFFLDEHLQNHYISLLRQTQALGLCAGVAVLLSCIGLYGLTAAAAERRTREIGIRKALGAESTAIVRLLLWQFTRPVLWASVLAWAFAAWVMQRWLEEFAYRVALPLWLFPAASLVALLIAIVTVSGHALAIARTRPVLALRHE